MSPVRRRGVERRRLLVLVAAASLFATILATTGAASAKHHVDEVDFTLTILHNNDGESRLLPDEDEGGVARFATAVKDAKKAAVRGTDRGVIMVSSGDNFLAGPAFTASLNDGVFYDAIALDLLGYDAIAIGNHDFDFGPDVLAEFISDGFSNPGKPPYLSSNLDFGGEPALQDLFDDGVIAESTIVKEREERIGIVGATTPNLPFISSPRNVVVIEDVAAEVQAEIDAMTAAGVDKIVFISHLQGIAEDQAVIGELSGVDVAVAGGGDELLANYPTDLLLPSDDPVDIFGPYPLIAVDADGNDVPVVTTSGQYGYLGRLVVDFDADGNATGWWGGPIRIVDPAVGADGVKQSSRMNNRVVEPVADFVAELAANIIATSEVDLDGRRNAVRSVETNEGSLIADALRWQADQLAAGFGVPSPDVALQNGGGIRNDSIIPAGPISELDTFSMVPFPNFLAVFPAIPRAQFKDILENAVSRVGDPPPEPPGGSGRFAQVSGFSFEWDQAQPDGSKVKNVVLDDSTVIVDGAGAVVPGADLTVATIDFLARGGDQYPFGTAPFTVLGVSYQQALANYIQAPTADGGLGGTITAADYPEGGEGRITRFN